MKSALWLSLVVALVISSACAKSDWIERTVVTVDVTGSSYGRIKRGAPTTQQMWLDQSTNSSGPTEGTISGDILRYKLVRGASYVELTVNGDEMNGVTAARLISLQRNASAPPR